MSSPKPAAATRPKPAATKSTRRTRDPSSSDAPLSDAPPSSVSSPSDVLSSEAIRLAGQVEAALQEGRIDALTPQALHALMAAGCKLYGAQIEAGRDVLPLAARTTVSATEVMTTASGLLRAVNLAVFELGMWQSWTGR